MIRACFSLPFVKLCSTALAKLLGHANQNKTIEKNEALILCLPEVIVQRSVERAVTQKGPKFGFML